MATKRPPLGDEALILRYGLMELPHLRDAVERCKIVRKFYGLSFFGENGLTVEEIALAAPSPHNWVRVAAYGALREAGFRLRRDGAGNHLVLRFEGNPTDSELRRLVKLFDEPQENPHPL